MRPLSGGCFRCPGVKPSAGPAQELEHRLDRRLEAAERSRVGVTQLRRFLEQLLQRRWGPPHQAPLLPMASVPAGPSGTYEEHLPGIQLPPNCQLWQIGCDHIMVRRSWGSSTDAAGHSAERSCICRHARVARHGGAAGGPQR